MRASTQINLKTMNKKIELLSATKVAVSSMKNMLGWSDRLGSDEIAEIKFVIEHLDQAVFDLETSEEYRIWYEDLKS